MDVQETSLPGVLLITPKVFGDQRGFFQETFSQSRYERNGIVKPFIQDNHSRSEKGVLRGLHYQLRNPQGKLVTVIRGAVYDVAVDIRVGSPTYKKWYGVELNDTNHYQLYVPPGFAHGFVVISDVVDFIYKCTEYYDPKDEQGIIWNDPEIGVEWPIETPRMSQKDQINPTLKELARQNALPLY